MSLSNPSLTTPSQRFYEWSGSRGTIEYYDKEKGERINVKLPFKFIVLDELHTITGYNDQDQSGYWSNEVRTTREDFTVRTKRGVKYVGSYKNDQGIVQMPQGAKYAKSIYIAHKIGDDWVIGNLKASGVALTSWIDLSGKHRTEGNITAVTGSTEGSKGATKFLIPTFEYGGAPTGDILEIATDLDRELQAYLTKYLNAPKFDGGGEPIADNERVTHAAEQEEDDKAIETYKHEVAKTDTILDDLGDEPINLDDIPF